MAWTAASEKNHWLPRYANTSFWKSPYPHCTKDGRKGTAEWRKLQPAFPESELCGELWPPVCTFSCSSRLAAEYGLLRG